jgi:hypothetical protein
MSYSVAELLKVGPAATMSYLISAADRRSTVGYEDVARYIGHTIDKRFATSKHHIGNVAGDMMDRDGIKQKQRREKLIARGKFDDFDFMEPMSKAPTIKFRRPFLSTDRSHWLIAFVEVFDILPQKSRAIRP